MMSGDMLNPALAAFVADHGVALLAKPFDLRRALAEIVARPASGTAAQPRG